MGTHKNTVCFIVLMLVCTVAHGVSLIEAFGLGRVYLVGDSILDNQPYVPQGESVYAKTLQKHEDTMLLARDSTTVNGLGRQLRQIDRPNSTVVISAGGNDILNLYAVKSIDDTRHLDRVFETYTRLVKNCAKTSGASIRLVDIYYPPASRIHRYYPLIERWNAKQLAFARKNKFRVIQVSKGLRSPVDFTHAVEPSEIGGAKVATAILER